MSRVAGWIKGRGSKSSDACTRSSDQISRDTSEAHSRMVSRCPRLQETPKLLLARGKASSESEEDRMTTPGISDNALSGGRVAYGEGQAGVPGVVARMVSSFGTGKLQRSNYPLSASSLSHADMPLGLALRLYDAFS